MNTLEFEKFGVQGLDAREMANVDGGWIKEVGWWVLEKVVEAFIEDPTSFVSPNVDTTLYGHMGGARP